MSKIIIQYPWLSGLLLVLCLGGFATEVYERATRTDPLYKSIEQSKILCVMAFPQYFAICKSRYRDERKQLDETKSKTALAIGVATALLGVYFAASLKFPESRLRFVHILAESKVARGVMIFLLIPILLPGFYFLLHLAIDLYRAEHIWPSNVFEIYRIVVSAIFLASSASTVYFFEQMRTLPFRYSRFLLFFLA